MTSRRARRAVALVLAAVGTSAGCGGGDAGAPVTADPAVTQEGRSLYLQNCASCHGDDLRGTAKGPPHLSRIYEPSHHSDDAFRSAIANGSPQHHWNFGNMDPVPGLSPADVDAIIAFVRDTQTTEGLDG